MMPSSSDSMGMSHSKGFLNGLTPGQALLFGFLVSLCILSVGLNIVLGVLLVKKSSGGSDSVMMVQQQQPSAAAPAQQAPQPSAGPQNFTITKDNHVRGNFKAPVTLVEFSDFQCPYCGSFHPTVKQVLQTYGDKVRLVYKHFPLPFHPFAQKGAEASECASEQGKFWEMHDVMFEHQDLLSFDQLKKWAREIGLNGSKFDSCLDSGKFASKVQADLQEGESKGITGTPGTFVNGQLVSGAVPFASLKQIIDQALAGK